MCRVYINLRALQSTHDGCLKTPPYSTVNLHTSILLVLYCVQCVDSEHVIVHWLSVGHLNYCEELRAQMYWLNVLSERMYMIGWVDEFVFIWKESEGTLVAGHTNSCPYRMLQCCIFRCRL